jgi:hypothetical protein
MQACDGADVAGFAGSSWRAYAFSLISINCAAAMGCFARFGLLMFLVHVVAPYSITRISK